MNLPQMIEADPLQAKIAAWRQEPGNLYGYVPYGDLVSQVRAEKLHSLLEARVREEESLLFRWNRTG